MAETITQTSINVNAPENERLVTLDEAKAEQQEILALEQIETSQSAANAAKQLAHLVTSRNVHETAIYPLSGPIDWKNEHNPSDEELKLAAERVAVYSIRRDKLAQYVAGLVAEGVMHDDEGVLYPLDVSSAGYLVNIAELVQDNTTIGIAEAAIEDIRDKGEEKIADEFEYELKRGLGTLTDAEREKHHQELALDTLREEALADAMDRVERLNELDKLSQEELAALEVDDAVPYDPFADNDE